jgi:hypothetical protein
MAPLGTRAEGAALCSGLIEGVRGPKLESSVVEGIFDKKELGCSVGMGSSMSCFFQ